MNILQLCKYYPPTLGGIELVEKTITKAHTDLGDNVFIVAFYEESTSQVGAFCEHIKLIREDLFFKSAPINFRFIFDIRSLVIKHQIERVYVHLPNPYMHEVVKSSKAFLQKHRVEVVAVYHSDIVNQKILGKIYNLYFNFTKGFYDKWVCSSQKLWNSSTILKDIAENKKRIIPFCTDGVMTYIERVKFKGKILAVGRLVPYKGFDFLIRAINKTNYQLNIVGNGPEYKKLSELGNNNIVFHRGINDQQKKELFDQCDLLIVSSINRSEAYGMIIVEAFESGVPVISSNINSGVTYLVQHEATGLVFDIENEDQLLKSIKRLENDSHLYSSIARNSKCFFDNELAYPNFLAKIKNI